MVGKKYESFDLKTRVMHLSRGEALKAGAMYYHGSQCKRGHSGVRYTGSGQCVSCNSGRKARKRNAKNGTSKMVEIDHMIDMDKGYYDDLI